MRRLYALILLLLCLITAKAQYNFKGNDLPEEISILHFASLLNTGSELFSLNQIIAGEGKLPFTKLNGKLGNLGFTNANYWLKFQLKNQLSTPILYYLHTAEPVTDNVDLYLINTHHHTEIQQSGDNIAFSQRAVKNRRTIFKIELAPGELKTGYMAIRNDGEKNSLPLVLISQQRFLEKTYSDQLVMGIFYGILTVIAITYFFFYFALNELSFLYYSLYVLFVGLCQFALDGFYHQYLGTGNSWLSLHAVILSAIFSCFFFGKYSQIILNLKEKNPGLHQLFRPLYILLGLVLAAVVLVPAFLKFSYPIINILTLSGMVLIFVSIAILIIKKQGTDVFYTIGIVVLFMTIIMAILMNFGVFPESAFTDNVTKLGIGLEIIALSLSMANRIRLLKSKEQEFQTIALQKSEEMNDIKSFFLANMSHELRTPLTAILGLAAIIEIDNDDPKLRENCEIIKYTAHGLISSINDILDFSKIEKGELQLDKVEFNPYITVSKIAQTTKKQCAEKGLSFSFTNSLTEDSTIIGDPVRLEQIIHNVLANAVKFTVKGNVSFEIKSVCDGGRLMMTILIKDTGQGIRKEKLERVFDLFSQTNITHKRKHGGFGIGLTIVKALTDLHGGKINLESELDKGTSCEIELSYVLQQKKELPISKYPRDENDLLGSHVLIVEDNVMNQMIIKMLMSKWKNTKISIANNGLECLELMKTAQIDVVLMDLQMPVMDGYEAISAIKNGNAGENNINVPIIVITADITSQSKEQVVGMGVNDYMNKPIEKDLLYEKITAALSA